MITVTVDGAGVGKVHLDDEDPAELREHIVVLNEVLLKFETPETLHKLIDIAAERNGAEITENGPAIS